MSEDIRRNEGRSNAGITTADLANFNEQSRTRGVEATNQQPEEFEGVEREDIEAERNVVPMHASSVTRYESLEGETRSGRNGDEMDFEENAGANGANKIESESDTPLFSASESKDFHARWDAVQVGFVDEPRHAVEEADQLVAGAIQRLAEVFAEERARLEGQWDRGDRVSTEDLRLALRRYRSFFSRLLSI